MPSKYTARDNSTLMDIDVAARQAVEFVRGQTYAAFAHEPLLQSAVLYQVAVIGEAVKRLSPELRRDHPEVPWRRAAGMRDRLIHGYDTVDLELIWRTVPEGIPQFRESIAPLLPAPSASDDAKDESS